MHHLDYYGPDHHEAASKFIGQRNLGLIIRQVDWRNRGAKPDKLDGLPLTDPAEWEPNGAPLARETDEEACTCHSPDRIACDLFSCLGTNDSVTHDRQEHDRACRQLRTDRPDGGRQAGLLDEVLQSAGTAATAAGS